MTRMSLATAVAVTGVLAACAATASATTFSGGCSTAGTVTITPPSGFIPHAASHHYDGRGECSGTLDGVRVASAPVTYIGGAAFGIHSCEFNSSTRGPAVLTFFPGTPRERALRVLQSTTGTGAVYLPLVQGAQSGIALGTLALPFTADVIAACQTSSFGSWPITIAFGTITSLVG
jgi:hypothetical protein